MDQNWIMPCLHWPDPMKACGNFFARFPPTVVMSLNGKPDSLFQQTCRWLDWWLSDMAHISIGCLQQFGLYYTAWTNPKHCHLCCSKLLPLHLNTTSIEIPYVTYWAPASIPLFPVQPVWSKNSAFLKPGKFESWNVGSMPIPKCVRNVLLRYSWQQTGQTLWTQPFSGPADWTGRSNLVCQTWNLGLKSSRSTLGQWIVNETLDSSSLLGCALTLQEQTSDLCALRLACSPSEPEERPSQKRTS